MAARVDAKGARWRHFPGSLSAMVPSMGMRDLQDRVAVVTGAAAGIGRAISLELARAGMQLMLADRDTEGLERVASEVDALGRRAVCMSLDVRELSSLEQLLARTLSTFGRCDVMVNNAGVFHGAALLDTEPSQWQRVLDTNLWGVIHGCRVFGRHFVEQGTGHLVNTASAAGLFPAPGMSAYSTSKFAVVGLSLQLRWELAASGVGVTVLCPGVVQTGIARAQGVGLDHVDLSRALARAPAPEGLARKTVAAIRKNRPMVRYGLESYLFGALAALPMFVLDPLGRAAGAEALRVVRGQLPPR
jgi:NAD(P)-dependent dehydrogenase (short-subunit alcohol dehydrogenase family)